MFLLERPSKGHIPIPARTAGPFPFIPYWEVICFAPAQIAFGHYLSHKID